MRKSLHFIAFSFLHNLLGFGNLKYEENTYIPSILRLIGVKPCLNFNSYSYQRAQLIYIEIFTSTNKGLHIYTI